jgi:hypothetical protein
MDEPKDRRRLTEELEHLLDWVRREMIRRWITRRQRARGHRRIGRFVVNRVT